MISQPINLSPKTARILAIMKQGLHRRPTVVNKQVLLNTIRQIGLIQIDAINVTHRSHYLVMLSRVGLYDTASLDELTYPDRSVFEQWAHAASLIPTEHYTYFAPIIQARRRIPLRERKIKALGADPQATLKAVLAQIRKHGPLASKDFEDQREERGSWWNRKPAKIALDVLFDWGHLMVDRRVNFQIYYDLAKRVLPECKHSRQQVTDEWLRWVTLNSVRCLGAGTLEQICDYYRQDKPSVRRMIEVLIAEGQIVPAQINGWKEIVYLDPSDSNLIEEIEAGGQRPMLTTFLSPFDNLIWDRKRVHSLFNFDYKIEIYTPLAKRKHGYYVLPILYRDRLVGRLDPKVDRQTGTLIIHSLSLESTECFTEDLLSCIANALHEFMSFHTCREIVIEHSEPKRLKNALLGKIRRIKDCLP